MTDYAFILSKKYKGKEWAMNGDDYEGIIWLDKLPIPKMQLDLDYSEYRRLNDYKAKRAKEYPPVVDQLDMIYNEGLPAWKAAIKKIKDKYPKPE